MASIHRRAGSRYWHAAWRGADGRLRLRSTKQTDRKKALAVALEFERADQAAKHALMTETQARKVLGDIMARTGAGVLPNPSIEQVMQEFLAQKCVQRSQGTFLRYEKTVQQFLGFLGSFAKEPITKLTPAKLESFLQWRLKSGVSTATAVIDLKTIRIALNRARRQGLIDRNPSDSVELPTAEHVHRETFTPTEVLMLVEAADGEWRTLILVGYYTGARLSDCVRMRWSDIDFVQRTWTYQQGKTGKTVCVPLHPELQRHLEQLAGDQVGEYVMPGMADKGPGGQHGLSEGFKRIMRKAGVDCQRVFRSRGVRGFSRRSFHSLRHSFVSHLANAGVPSEIRMRLTGHSTEPTHKVYTHHELEVLREAVEKIPDLR